MWSKAETAGPEKASDVVEQLHSFFDGEVIDAVDLQQLWLSAIV